MNTGPCTSIGRQLVVSTTETSEGIYECDVPEYGTYTVSDGTDQSTVEVNIVGIYTCHTASGSTILPVNDVSIWLSCASRTEQYTTLSEVFGDTTCLSALISSHNAMDYLVRCTSWVSDICNNSDAMSYIGLDNYAADKLLNDSTWCNAIGTSTNRSLVLNIENPNMTSNTTPRGVCSASSTSNNTYAWSIFDGSWSTYHCVDQVASAWVQYKFAEPVLIKYIEMLGGNKQAIQASNDGSNFVEIGNFNGASGRSGIALPNNTQKYSYYRIFETWASATWNSTYEVRMYGREDV